MWPRIWRAPSGGGKRKSRPRTVAQAPLDLDLFRARSAGAHGGKDLSRWMDVIRRVFPLCQRLFRCPRQARYFPSHGPDGFLQCRRHPRVHARSIDLRPAHGVLRRNACEHRSENLWLGDTARHDGVLYLDGPALTLTPGRAKPLLCRTQTAQPCEYSRGRNCHHVACARVLVTALNWMSAQGPGPSAA